MQHLHMKAASLNAQFEFLDVHGLWLLYDNPGTHGYQLFIPKMGGLQELLLTELHCSDLSGHLGIFKTLYALVYRV